MNQSATAINMLARRCLGGKFSTCVIILEKYDTISKIQLEHESGFKMITLTENTQLDIK